MSFQAPKLEELAAPEIAARFSPAEIEQAIADFETVKAKKAKGERLDLTDVKKVVLHARVIRTEHFNIAEASKKKKEPKEPKEKVVKAKKVREPKRLTPAKLNKVLVAYQNGTVGLADLHDLEFSLYGEIRSSQEDLERHNLKHQLEVDHV